MNNIFDVIIIGSGVSGVCAAWPLVLAGLNVAMLDQGKDQNSSLSTIEMTYLDNRQYNFSSWKEFLGEDFSGLEGGGDVSPKFRVPKFKFVTDGFKEAYNINTSSIIPTGSLALGGLSRMWGAGAYNFFGNELNDYPFSSNEINESYKTVAERIGLNGVNDDLEKFLGNELPLISPMSLNNKAEYLLKNYHSQHDLKSKYGISLGQARNTVFTKRNDKGDFCDQLGMCMWGCSRDAIYTAKKDITKLKEYNNFHLFTGSFVNKIKKESNYYSIETFDLDEPNHTGIFNSKKLISAAGTIATTILVSKYLKKFDNLMQLICHPAYAILFTLPKFIGQPFSNNNFALGQLAYLIENKKNELDYIFGVLFSLEGLAAQEIIRHIPMSRPNAVKLGKYLIPSLLVANGYLSGQYSDCKISINPNRTYITGDHREDFLTRVKFETHKLKKFFRQLGAYALPLGTKIARLGSDGHFVGTLPMRKYEAGLSTDANGMLFCSPGFYIADGASLPSLPAKHPTFTIMANADRISKNLIRDWRK